MFPAPLIKYDLLKSLDDNVEMQLVSSILTVTRSGIRTTRTILASRVDCPRVYFPALLARLEIPRIKYRQAQETVRPMFYYEKSNLSSEICSYL